MRSVWIHVAALAALPFFAYGVKPIATSKHGPDGRSDDLATSKHGPDGRSDDLETFGVMLVGILGPYEALKTLYLSIKPAHKGADGKQMFAARYRDADGLVTVRPRHLLYKEIQYLTEIKNSVMENISRLDDLKKKIADKVINTAELLNMYGITKSQDVEALLKKHKKYITAAEDFVDDNTMRPGPDSKTKKIMALKAIFTHPPGAGRGPNPPLVIPHNPLSGRAYKKNPTAYRPYVLTTFGEHLFKGIELFTIAYYRMINRGKTVGVLLHEAKRRAKVTGETLAELEIYAFHLDGRISDIDFIQTMLNEFSILAKEDLKAKIDLWEQLSAETPQRYTKN